MRNSRSETLCEEVKIHGVIHTVSLKWVARAISKKSRLAIGAQILQIFLTPISITKRVVEQKLKVNLKYCYFGQFMIVNASYICRCSFNFSSFRKFIKTFFYLHAIKGQSELSGFCPDMICLVII